MRSFIVLLILGLTVSAIAQQARFDVVSIKRAAPDANGMSVSSSGNRFRTTNVSVVSLILNAYPEFHSFQIVNAPDWARTEGYDIQAVSDLKLTPDAIGEMLQSLLADRFKVEMHAETQELLMYTLSVAKDGPKLQSAKDGEAVSVSGGRGKMTFRSIGMSGLASNLALQLDRLVVDQTKLSGKYTFTLEWTPDSVRDANSTAPSLFTAVQEQLGLKLESTRGPVEILVIDHIEKPTEN